MTADHAVTGPAVRGISAGKAPRAHGFKAGGHDPVLPFETRALPR